jgi:tetratricopeptide (TPR) repeat protein
MAAGVAGVVAMRYNVYVVTAAQLVAELYESLGRGSTLGEAMTLARGNLYANPLREVASDPRPLQDWTVPVVYEAAPVQLFPKVRKSPRSPRIKAGGTATAGGSLDSSLPPPPAAGFFGRDETLLALDQSFNHDSIVLLHAYAGSGKTATAAEFARWYSLTGGMEGPVLFTSFERYLPLPRVLDQVGQVFEASLEEQGIHWLALDDPARRETALRVLSETPVLWIWDNVEPVTGFPAGTESAWSAREQDELASFLKEAWNTKAMFLLTSRRDESAWLGVVPFRVTVPPMPLLESFQLARALAAQRGRPLSGAGDWRPLLEFAQGNPLTVTVLVGQALREGLATKREIEGFVERLRSGEASFTDERDEGRSRSLGASLAYGFENAFREEELEKLALLHLFQGFVNVDTVCIMGAPEVSWSLPQIRALTRAECADLLRRAAEIGLLTAHGDQCYAIHPALPWFFKRHFETFYREEERLAAVRAFVGSVGGLANYYQNLYREGDTGFIDILKTEEANLLHACRLARAHGWWDPLISVLQGLRRIYSHTGRGTEWKRLVEEILPSFVDPADGSPLPGREGDWTLVTNYRVGLAREERRLSDAERLQERIVAWLRPRTAPFLERPVAELEDEERDGIEELGASLNLLGDLRLELGRADCVPAYEEALRIADRLGNRAEAAIVSTNLGQTFVRLPGLEDLDQAERWHKKSLKLRPASDTLGRGTTLARLGNIALTRFNQALSAGPLEEESFQHLDQAARLYHDALDCLPPDAVNEIAVIHHQLGSIYLRLGDLEGSLSYYQQAIQEHEKNGDLYAAAQSRFNTAIALMVVDHRPDALEYAMAALRGFESYGDKVAEEIESARQLIAQIRGA